MGRVEIFKNRQAFFKVRDNRCLNNFTRWFRHQAAHSCKLLHLRWRTTRAGVGHHVDRVDLLVLAVSVLLHRRNADHHLFGQLVRALRPGINNLVVLLALSDQAVIILLLIFLRQSGGVSNNFRLGFRHNHVVLTERNTGLERFAEACRHDAVTEYNRLLLTAVAVDGVDHVRDFFLGHQLVDDVERNLVMRRNQLAQNHTARRGIKHLLDALTLCIVAPRTTLDLGVQGNDLGMDRRFQLINAGEDHALADIAITNQRQIIQAQNNVLRRNNDRLTIGRMQNVVGRHHQHACFKLRFKRQRHVDRHLVTVKVGVERRTDERMQTNGLAFNQHRFKGLNAQAMQRWRAVQHHGMFADNLIENIPNLRLLLLHQLLGLLHSGRQPLGVQARIDEWLEQFECHFLWQTALMQLQFRTHNNNRAARIIDALAKQVLTETALLALEHVCQRLQRTLVRTGNNPAATAVVKQRVNRFLQHALFVTDNDVRRAQFDQPLQTVVTVDNAAIQIVQIRRGKATAIQRHQRAQIRRDNRNFGQDHPFRLVAGHHERFDDFQTLGELLRLQFRSRFRNFNAQFTGNPLQIHCFQDFADGFGADQRHERVLAIFVLSAQIFVFRQQLAVLQRRQIRVKHDVGFKIQNPLEIFQRHIKQQADTRRQALQEPDMRDRCRQRNMAHALAPDTAERYFNAALFADNALILHALVLAAQAFVILDRPEDAGTEQAITLRLESPVVDCLWLLDFAKRPRENFLWAGNANVNIVKRLRQSHRIEEIHNLLIHIHLLELGRTCAATRKNLKTKQTRFTHEMAAGVSPCPQLFSRLSWRIRNRLLVGHKVHIEAQ